MNTKEKLKEKLWCEALSRGHIMQYKALGGSMSPFIKSGDILVVESDKTISIGDVVLYERDECFAAHRVVGRKKMQKDSFFLTKGDALRSCDSLVSASEVLGKVVTVKTRKGKIVKMDSFVRRIFGLGIAILSLFLFPKILPILRKTKALAFNRSKSQKNEGVRS